jgi:hypothetical protein
MRAFNSVHRPDSASYRLPSITHRESRVKPAAAAYDCGVGSRVIHRADLSIRKKNETLTLWKIMAAIAFPLLLASVLVSVDMRADLSELRAAAQADEKGVTPLGWADLEAQGAPGWVRMIGYMMDGYRPSKDSAAVDMFILLPEAGQFLHPAHRDPGQMVEVWPRHLVHFTNRELVWAIGILNRTAGRTGDEKAAWAMGDAEVEPAVETDIVKWFQP